jgi:ABC-type multidrug transport system fused ATPase/permease subunit
MSDFLSDIQICEIIQVRRDGPHGCPASGMCILLTFLIPLQKFKTIKASAEPALSHKMSNRIAFMAGSGMIKRRRPSIPFQSRSSMSMGSEKSGVFSGDGRDSRMIISRAEFVEFYPQLLLEVTLKNDVLDSFASNEANYPGVDISFVDLNLKVRLGSKSLKVVDGATGRICAKTMTAVMGGSGTGKTSLLNALCGRAFYGETSGEVYVNGHKTSIDDHKDAVGFVPQVRFR